MELSTGHHPSYTEEWEYEEDHNDDFFENNSAEGEILTNNESM